MMTDPTSERSEPGRPVEAVDDDGVSAWERVFAEKTSPGTHPPVTSEVPAGADSDPDAEAEATSDTTIARQEVSSDGDPDVTGPDATAAGRRPLVVNIARAVLALALVAATTAAVVEWRRAERLDHREAARRDIALTAAALGQALLSYDYTNLNAARTTVLRLSTEKFAQYYTTAFTNGLSAAVTQLQAKATASVRKVFVAETNGETADVFVLLDSEVHSSAGTRQLVGSYLDLAMVRQGGHWKVDGVTSIAATSDNLTPPGAAPGPPAPSTPAPSTPTPSTPAPSSTVAKPGG